MPEEKVSRSKHICREEPDSGMVCPACYPPAADAGPRQPEPQVSELLGKYLNTMVSDLRIEGKGNYLRWLFSQYEHELAAVPQEVASLTIPSSNDDPAITQAVRKVVEDYGGTLQMLGNSGQAATAPDEAMRVAMEYWICYWNKIPGGFTGTERAAQQFAAALIRQARSQRERELTTALRNLRDRLQIIMAWPEPQWSDHLPIEIADELASASRLLGGESK